MSDPFVLDSLFDSVTLALQKVGAVMHHAARLECVKIAFVG